MTLTCGHDSKWLAYRNPVDSASETYCVFCEMDNLRKKLAAIRDTGVQVERDAEYWVMIPRSVWMNAVDGSKPCI